MKPNRPKKLRVLHVVPSLQGGGAERVLLTVVRGLPELSHVLAVTCDGPLGHLVPAGVPVRTARSELALARLMSRFKPDLVQTWLDDSLVLAAVPAAQLGIPVVHRVYNTPSVHRAYEPGLPGYNAVLGRALAGAARVIALSRTAAADAAVFYRIPQPTVIVNGLPLAGNRGTSRASIEKPSGRFVILSVGRLEPQKGHAHLVDAFASVAARHAHAELWIAGVGQLRPSLAAQAAAAGLRDRVKFIGFHEDVTALHAAADLFVFPSMFEGFGNALAEALVAGLPIVASDLEVIRRDVFDDKPVAVLVPPGDVAALAGALDRLIPDLPARTALGHAAREAGARFSRARMLDEYRQLYADLANERAAA